MKRFFLLTMMGIMLSASCASSRKGVSIYSVTVDREFPHDTSSYTQGLFFHGGALYESAGQYGHSNMRKVDLESGKPLFRHDFDDRYFLEGSTILDGKLFILTWLEGKVFVCNPDTFEEEAQFDIRRQGWGLTTDGTQLIMSDGSAQLFFINPARFDIVRSITVRRDGKSVRWLNELEYIDGRIWANVYLTDEIVIINPESGEVEGVVDCTGLLPEELRSPDTDVLNGIAYNPEDGAIYITGKYWPRMYKIGPLKK